MANIVLGPMLRHVDDHSATVWVETDAPCEVEVLGYRSRTFAANGHHYGLVIVEGLAPGQTVTYAVALDGVSCWPLPDAPGAERHHHP